MTETRPAAIAPRPTEQVTREWRNLLLAIGLISLVCYFFSSVFHVVPPALSRVLFYAFGPTLALAAVAGYRVLCARRDRPLLELGFFMVVVAGISVNSMAVIQDTIFTAARRRIAAFELEPEREMVRHVLRGTNDVQLALDIVFDLWISAGVAFLAWGVIRYLGHRLFGLIGLLIAAGALGVNFATLPTPPAEAGLFDPGPAVATWLGLFLALVMRAPRPEPAS